MNLTLDDAPDIESLCSCPLGNNCKHVAALIEYLQRPGSPQVLPLQ